MIKTIVTSALAGAFALGLATSALAGEFDNKLQLGPCQRQKGADRLLGQCSHQGQDLLLQ